MTQLNNELATAQRKMAKQNARLERPDEQKNQFLGMAGHDLRNPLGVVATCSELLLKELTDVIGAEHRSFLQHIHTSSTFMLGMVNELLEISKFESGNLELALAPVDLRELLTRTVMLNRVFAERKQIEIELAMPDELPPSPLDELKLEQVFNNLLSNACKYSHPHTTIRVSAQRRDNEAIITIQGQGIPSAELAQIFEPFRKTSVKSTEGELSTGLGLAIVRRIVEGHGGQIQVESAVGEGTTFYFSLPLAVDQPTADKPKPTATGPWPLAHSAGRGQCLLPTDDVEHPDQEASPGDPGHRWSRGARLARGATFRRDTDRSGDASDRRARNHTKVAPARNRTAHPSHRPDRPLPRPRAAILSRSGYRRLRDQTGQTGVADRHYRPGNQQLLNSRAYPQEVCHAHTGNHQN
ncbi:MAG TPA: HAMP domain-containing histidine kinase [Candidatus Latescibacteria bacterium]|nr:HAMP domain-containing histidine kinase [Candidatus Handelsmanbacteria bacterium]HIL09996.1 HAMP domain-containing histidine kinase [Candidatus Latescibacterota bacterium]